MGTDIHISIQREAKNPYIQTSWKESARVATGDWLGQVIPWLEMLAEGKPLILVMGFDS